MTREDLGLGLMVAGALLVLSLLVFAAGQMAVCPATEETPSQHSHVSTEAILARDRVIHSLAGR